MLLKLSHFHLQRRTQTFPYSRHSSYTELCQLIEAFKPADIWPCTVDKANWSPAQSMSFLFGHLYDAPCKFTHDQSMLRKTTSATVVVPESRAATPGKDAEHSTKQATKKRRRTDDETARNMPPPTAQAGSTTSDMSIRPSATGSSARLEFHPDDASSLSPHEYSEAWKRQAFEAALGGSSTDWNDIALVSVSGHHQECEEEL